MKDMPSAYDASSVEAPLYQMWMDKGYFRPRIVPGRDPFSIIMPPPNVTGELHLGHALTSTIEDLLIRWHRMLGDPTLWVPGVDHAGIATQNVVEREIAKEGIDRHDLGREKFEERVWQWVGKVRSRIGIQHMRLGVSCDWDREVFTLDEGPQKAVRTTFKRLYDDGLIYRGERITNWCPRCQTALSDLEVDHVPTQGKLWHFKYPLLDNDGNPTDEYIRVATTRPETIVGDTAVAVNPADDRWQALIDRAALLPIVERPIPIIADDAVEMEFGTGAVKVTPGHDPNDFDIGGRHNLPIVVAMDAEAKMNENAGPYNGVDRFEARKLIVADFDRLGLLEKIEDHTSSIGHCSRCDTIVEPIVSMQWFVKTAALATPAIDAVKDGRIQFVPKRFERDFMHWMENIHDWCISRQLWWGHRIPVWYCGNGHMFSAIEDPAACAECGSATLEQESDVLDTWFSSGLWPHSTLGWPEDSEDLRYWYPTSVLETGYDIIFFWVARMIMLGLYNMGDVPFRHVYLHGLIRDEKGQKMTKSRGNVVDPLEIIEKYGTDAVRFTLATGGTPGNDFRLFDEKLEQGRNFANKIWNASRYFVQSAGGRRISLPDPAAIASLNARASWPLEDRWIVSRTLAVSRDVNRLLFEFQVNEAARLLYDFFWSEYADWYVEMAKVRLKSGDTSPLPVLAYALAASLRLLHPIMPFVTEAIWQHLRDHIEGLEEALIIAAFPLGEGEPDPEAERQANLLMDVVRAIRNIRAERGVDPGRFVEAYIASADTSLAQATPLIETLARARPLHLIPHPSSAPTTGVATAVLTGAQVILPLANLIDLTAERDKLSKQLTEAQTEITRLESKLSNEEFRSKAPAPVIAKEQEKLTAAQSRAQALQTRLTELG
ncbi:MAG TPA: valine--tRNA ligase [Dehalococcoidia bacterium]|nr:valine--tRNA ligase [Dehalococcoidia bacterium]